MKTSKKWLVSDELKPLVSKIIKENREKYHYSLEDLSTAINHKKNRQTLHKYENGTLNIPYDILFEICNIFKVDTKIFEEATTTEEEQSKINQKIVKNYMKSLNPEQGLTREKEKLLEIYKNCEYNSLVKTELAIKVLDDSMAPIYQKNDKVYFETKKEYANGDDIIVAIKPGILTIRRLYKYPKGIILQAINPKYQTININIISNDMIIGKVNGFYRKI